MSTLRPFVLKRLSTSRVHFSGPKPT